MGWQRAHLYVLCQSRQPDEGLSVTNETSSCDYPLLRDATSAC